ncbi:HEAT repeat domain-containing protein [Acinetobacter puyangensis]|uniref:HEAT repeat n=1 Tax=Acinetobacter puyangensis TaxID=1096779 RepID=A0A240EAM4_9GAMM|nr:HEAT repeat domain-containing protein [Acinetobacter puyangensis]SNX45712.1 HEAT repeat [Acinetobacter puyangensis]
MNIQYPEIPDLDYDDQDFLRQLNSKDEKVRFIALMNIAEEEREELLPWLYYALQYDPAVLVRKEAAKRLEGWENQATLQALAAALTDEAGEVVDAATQSLSEVKYPASAAILAPYLAVDNIDVKVAILRALKPLRPVELYHQIQQHTQHQEVTVRREAVSALSWLQQQHAVDILAQIAQHDTDAETRRIATGGLAYSKQNTAQVISALQSSLTSDDWQLRVEAALTIGKLKVLQLEQLLIELLSDVYWQVRIAVVRSLGLLKSSHALSGLADNFNHPMSNLRKEVALALGEIGGQQAEQLLLGHEQDADPEVRKAIRISLTQIRGRIHAT